MNTLEVIVLKFANCFPLFLYLLLVVIGLLSYGNKHPFYVFKSNSAGFDVFNGFSGVNPVGHYFFILNLSLSRVTEIKFVANQNDGNSYLRLIQVFVVHYAVDEVVLPLLDSFITVSVGNIKYYYAAICSSVEAITKTLEPFLSGCIPYLQRYSFTRVYFYLLLYEIGSNGRFVVQTGLLILVRLDKTALADP